MLKELKTAAGDRVNIHRLIIDSTSSSLTSDAELISPQLANRAFSASVSGSGATASVDIYVSNTGVNWIKYVTLNPTESTTDGYADTCPWPYVKADVTANTGALNVYVGC